MHYCWLVNWRLGVRRPQCRLLLTVLMPAFRPLWILRTPQTIDTSWYASLKLISSLSGQPWEHRVFFQSRLAAYWCYWRQCKLPLNVLMPVFRPLMLFRTPQTIDTSWYSSLTPISSLSGRPWEHGVSAIPCWQHSRLRLQCKLPFNVLMPAFLSLCILRTPQTIDTRCSVAPDYRHPLACRL